MSENERDRGTEFLMQAAHAVSPEKALALAQKIETMESDVGQRLMSSLAVANFATEEALVGFLHTLYKEGILGNLLKESGFTNEERSGVLNLLREIISQDQWHNFWKVASFAHIQRLANLIPQRLGMKAPRPRQIFGLSPDPILKN